MSKKRKGFDVERDIMISVDSFPPEAAERYLLEMRVSRLLRPSKKGVITEDKFKIPEPEKPKYRRFIVQNATYEKLSVILQDNPNGILTYRDEIFGLLARWEREENLEERNFYLSGWNGTGSFSSDRIGREDVYVPTVCLSVVGITQPANACAFADGMSAADGMLQRFMVVWPDQSLDWSRVDQLPDLAANKAYNDVFDRLNKLDPASVGAVTDPSWSISSATKAPIPYLRFDAAAQETFNEWQAGIEKAIRAPGLLDDIMRGLYGKLNGLAPKLALIIHLGNGAKGPVSKSALDKAIALVAYLETHAKRVYSAGVNPAICGAEAIITNIKAGALEEGFSFREVRRHGWKHLNTPVEIDAVLDLLTLHGWLREEERPSTARGGRPTTIYHINPKALAK